MWTWISTCKSRLILEYVEYRRNWPIRPQSYSLDVGLGLSYLAVLFTSTFLFIATFLYIVSFLIHGYFLPI